MIDPQTAATLALFAENADRQARLTPEQLDIIYREKWFRLFVPASQNGLELSLPEGLRIEEALAKIDGSLGWTVTLCSGATQFTGYLSPELTRSVFKDDTVCFGGSGALSGIAKETAGGYRINGSWKYATGAPYCTHFTANCKIEKDGKLLVNTEGVPVYRSFLFQRSEVTIVDDWDTMGLKATASQRFSIAGLEVPRERSFTIHPSAAILPGAVYRYPFLQFAEATLAVNTLGMARHFLEEFEELIRQKTTPAGPDSAGVLLQQKWQQATATLQFLRNRFYTAVDDSWSRLTTQGAIPAPVLDQVSKQSRLLARRSRKIVADLFPYCGVSATANGTTLNRIFRDVFTASQHLLLNFETP
ncbi:acyl-CoA dehydrogenase [Niabella beijingensis]|uniref:acyl-CoA dehydrogenase n=1 Tax=Niabella beijingensis TaxID=2872700 RepID=UPI001CBE29DF|nr:acyl-CoA dehydrogenase [Niabella beijingensis]MBZ4189572.1 acyl-CoA dehydrogenase [Niabella beijingensis]